MSRYFIEVAYKGTGYAGFQVQKNAVTIQGEIDKALEMLLKRRVQTTGSSRTDSGVHACQNFLHLDLETDIPENLIYKLNAVLSRQIAIRSFYKVPDDMHARFSAVSRTYEYRIYTYKDPFLQEFGYYFPYPLEEDILHKAAHLIKRHSDFTSFSKRNTQVKTFRCAIKEATWERDKGQYIFHIQADRFLRGMVRGLVGTILKTARGRMSLEDFRHLLEVGDNKTADFSVPPQGLFLKKVAYPDKLKRPL